MSAARSKFRCDAVPTAVATGANDTSVSGNISRYLLEIGYILSLALALEEYCIASVVSVLRTWKQAFINLIGLRL